MSNNKNFFKWIKDWFNRKRTKDVLLFADKPVFIGTPQEFKPIEQSKSTTHNIGWYKDVRSLKLLYPRANNGDIATVGNSIYIYEGRWIKQEKFP